MQAAHAAAASCFVMVGMLGRVLVEPLAGWGLDGAERVKSRRAARRSPRFGDGIFLGLVGVDGVGMVDEVGWGLLWVVNGEK